MALRRKKLVEVWPLKSGNWVIMRNEKMVAVFPTKEGAVFNAKKLSMKVVIHEKLSDA